MVLLFISVSEVNAHHVPNAVMLGRARNVWGYLEFLVGWVAEKGERLDQMGEPHFHETMVAFNC